MIILGPPGSGKGTRAKIIGKIYGLPVIATGDMLREAVSEGTPEGRVAKAYMERGELVPDEIVIGLVERRLKRLGDGFILDGYPRSLRQAEALDRILRDKGESLDVVLNVVLEPSTIINRLSLRRSCPRCGAVYHLRDKPPRLDEVCDECGAGLVQRSDDREEVIRHRLEVYEAETRPLLERYRKIGKVSEISGDLGIDEIAQSIKKVLSVD